MWASHTTLQSTTIQQLQRENSELKEEVSQLREKEGGGREGERVILKKGVSLESVERELFETKVQLETKVIAHTHVWHTVEPLYT